MSESRESCYKFDSDFFTFSLSEFETKFEKNATSFLNSINFPFVGIYKNIEGNICLFRESFGRIPLYYYFKGDILYYSSNISDLYKIYDGSLILNNSEVIKYLKIIFDTSYTEQTLVKNIFSVLPGHILEINLNNKSKKNICFFKIENKNETANINDFKNIFYKSIEKYLNLNILFGSQLSGGLDSSSIVSSVFNITKKPFPTIEYRSGDELVDETEYSKAIVQEFKLDHCLKYSLNNTIVKEFIELMYHSGLPDMAITPVGRDLLFNDWMTLKKLGLIFTGSGGDDVLGPRSIYLDKLFNSSKYNKYFSELKSMKKRFNIEKYPIKPIVFLIFAKLKNANWKTKIKMLMPIVKFGFLANVLFQGIKSKYNKFTKQKSNFDIKVYNEIEHDSDSKYFDSIKKNNGFYLEYVFDIFNSLYFKVMEQDYCIEQKSKIIIANPFLDKKLLDFMANSQDEFNFNKGIGRNYLRAAMEGIVPDKILQRVSKTDFGNTNKHAFNIFWNEYKQIFISTHPICQFVKIDEIFKLANDHEKKKLNGKEYLKLNRIIYLALWLDYLKENFSFN